MERNSPAEQIGLCNIWQSKKLFTFYFLLSFYFILRKSGKEPGFELPLQDF